MSTPKTRQSFILDYDIKRERFEKEKRRKRRVKRREKYEKKLQKLKKKLEKEFNPDSCEKTPDVNTCEEDTPDDTNTTFQNLCVRCNVNMGENNPRQLCGKTYCYFKCI